MQALLRFDSKAAALVLEEEVREAFFGSISTAIGMHHCCTAHQMQHHILHACSHSDVERRVKHACARRQDSKCSVANFLSRSLSRWLKLIQAPNPAQSMTQLMRKPPEIHPSVR